MAALILNFGTRERWVMSCMPWLVYPHGKFPQYQLNMIVGPRTGLDVMGKRKIVMNSTMNLSPIAESL